MLHRPVLSCGFVWGLLSVASAGAQPIQIDLQASRTFGAAPLAVFFDASGTTHTSGAIRPFHDLGYRWDFDDPTSGTWATNGRSRNSATGAVAAHVFETPGTYDVSVTVRDAAGAMAQRSVQVSVSDPGEAPWITYYVSTSGSDSNDGLSPASPFATLTRGLAEQGANRRILLRRGDSWSVSGLLQLTTDGPAVLGAYGEGAAPRVVATGNNSSCSFLSVHASDWRIVGLELTRLDSTYQCSGLSIGAARSDVLVLDNEVRGFRIGLTNDWSTVSDRLFWIDNRVEDLSLNGAYLGGHRIAVLGNRIAGIKIPTCCAFGMSVGE
ncbi:MAG: PKD domain-containing protein [Thermoanaerobaculia bacterium]|nr:PKD domain-containing protein [Thermoanaerobaculia bacterium]